MRNIFGMTTGLLLLGSLATAPAFAVDDGPDVTTICRTVYDMCIAICDAKFGDLGSINWNLCASACDGDERICIGKGSSIMLELPTKSLKQSRPTIKRP